MFFGGEALLERVQRARAYVAVDDAERRFPRGFVSTGVRCGTAAAWNPVLVPVAAGALPGAGSGVVGPVEADCCGVACCEPDAERAGGRSLAALPSGRG